MVPGISTCLIWKSAEALMITTFQTPAHCLRCPTCHSLRTTTLCSQSNMDGSFRKIDIDQYDEDVLLESELYQPDPRDPAQVLSDAKQNAAAVRQSLARYCAHCCCLFCFMTCICARNDTAGALATVLERAPYGPNVEEAKVTQARPRTRSSSMF